MGFSLYRFQIDDRRSCHAIALFFKADSIWAISYYSRNAKSPLGPIDFWAFDVGIRPTVYKGLLDSELSVAEVGPRALDPKANLVPRRVACPAR